MPPTVQKEKQQRSDGPATAFRREGLSHAACSSETSISIQQNQFFFFYRYSFYRYLSAYYRVGTAPGSDHNRPKVPASVECALCRGRSGKTTLTECQVTHSTEKTQWRQPRAGALPPPSHQAPRSSAWVGGMDLLSPELESPRAGSTDS